MDVPICPYLPRIGVISFLPSALNVKVKKFIEAREKAVEKCPYLLVSIVASSIDLGRSARGSRLAGVSRIYFFSSK